jgi:DNA polymerase-3 subunit alpha
MAMVALFRPGPMESIPEYIRRKNNPELVEYLDPRMKDYLDQSLGLMVYQDDVLLTAINLAGYNWEEVDKFRKAMGKKIPEEMAKQEEKFRRGCREVGHLAPELIDQLWERIKPFAAYGFNKAHACSYGVVAYQTAYVKANFPVQYMTAVLIAESGDMDKVPEIIAECERMGVRVLPPDVNESFKNFAMISAEDKPAHIRFGMNGVKNVGEHIAEEIYRERKANGSYQNLEDFLRRVKDKDLNKKSLESLIKCGALDSFGYDRGELVANIENLLAFSKQSQEQSNSAQFSLFAGTRVDLNSKVRIDAAPNAKEAEILIWEKELLGRYVTAHPFQFYADTMADTLTPVKELSGQPSSTWVVVGGVVDSVKKKITRNGAPMSFVTIQDLSGSLELLVFPRTYETTKDVWVEGKMVCVVGKTGDEEGDDKLFVEKAYELTHENAAAIAAQMVVNTARPAGMTNVKFPISKPSIINHQSSVISHITIYSDRVEITVSPAKIKIVADDIKKVLTKFPGELPVYILVGDKKIKTQYMVNATDELNSEIERVVNE